MKSRLLELDAIRGLAAVVVVLYHYFYRYHEIYGHAGLPYQWAQAGQYGVQLFFMVSGFVIFWTLARIEKPADFIVSRFSRLYPAYWASITLTFFAVGYVGLPGREVHWLQAVGNGLMFHEYLRIPHVDGVYWTLTVELTFYFWIFLLYLFGLLKRVEYSLLPVVALTALQGLGLVSLPSAINKLLLVQQLPFFLAGIGFYKLVHGERSAVVLFAIGFSWLAALADFSVQRLAAYSLCYLLFYLAVSGRLALLATRPLIFLGGISYALYLLHQNIGYLVIQAFYAGGLPPLAGIGLALAISLLLATLLTHCVERPAIRWIRELYANSAALQRLAGRLRPAGGA